MPQTKLAAVFNQVTFATFSRLQNEPARIRSAMQRAIEMLSFTMFPVFFAVSAYAPEFQRIVLGAKWADVVLPLQILAFVPPVRMINSHFIELLNGIGRPLASTSNLLLGIVVLVSASFAGLHWGVLGVAIAAVLTFPVVTALLMRKLVSSGLVSWEDLLLPLAGPFVASVAAWSLVMALRDALEPVIPLWQLLIVLGSAGPASYLMLMFLIAPRRLREVISYIRA